MWTVMVFLLAGPANSAVASQGPPDGKVLAVSIDKLLSMPELYDGKSVLTTGELDVAASRRGKVYTLRGSFGGRLVIVTAGAAQAWAEQAPRWIGREVEVTGLVSLTRPGTPAGTPPSLTDPDTGGVAIYITIWGFFGPTDEKGIRSSTGEVTLEDLTANPERFEGKEVTTLGQFRGANLSADLPAGSRHGASDWVIKDGPCAVWVTGKRPKGDGWSLDPRTEGNSSKWLRVTGRVSTSGGVVTIRAVSVSLTRSPSADSLPRQ